jgi:hypothetical protein
MSLNEFLKLKGNPFRMTPPLETDKIIWAGFPDLKERIENRIMKSMHFSNSSLVLNWGAYGSGKAHAANYFNQTDIIKKLADKKNKNKPFSLKITLPQVKIPVYDIFVSIIDYIDIEETRKNFSDISPEIHEFINQYSRNIIIRSILNAIFNREVDRNLLKKYLYNTISDKEFEKLSEHGILRKLSTDDDRIKVLSGIFACLTYKQEVFSNIIIWIDEFENIATHNNLNIESVNNFIRELLDNTPNYLLVFLNFTFSALDNIEDLGQFLSPAVRSRIKDRIEFEMPGPDELKLYLKELLNDPLYRDEPQENEYHPFMMAAIDLIIEILGNVSLRKYNEAFSILLESAEFEKEKNITRFFVEQHKDDITIWE